VPRLHVKPRTAAAHPSLTATLTPNDDDTVPTRPPNFSSARTLPCNLDGRHHGQQHERRPGQHRPGVQLCVVPLSGAAAAGPGEVAARPAWSAETDAAHAVNREEIDRLHKRFMKLDKVGHRAEARERALGGGRRLIWGRRRTTRAPSSETSSSACRKYPPTRSPRGKLPPLLHLLPAFVLGTSVGGQQG